MVRFKEIFRWQTVAGDRVTIGEVAITPQSQALTVRWPNGGFVWNRPVAVLVERGEETMRIPIVDATRVAQWVLFGLSLVFSLVVLILSARGRRE